MLDCLAATRRRAAIVSFSLAFLLLAPALLGPAPALAGAPIFAQASSVFDSPDASGNDDSLFQADSILVKSLIVVGVFLVAFLFLYYVLYGILVDSARWWPMSAYGLTAGLVVLLTIIAALWSFWDDLVINRGAGVGEAGLSWFDKWGLRATVALGGILAFVFLTYVFKSQRGRVRAG